MATAAFLGAICRYVVHDKVQAKAQEHSEGPRVIGGLPVGTLVVNTTGSLALGVLIGLSLRHGLGDQTLAVAGTGFLGAYTTFSTFGYETVRLVTDDADGGGWRAAANIAVSLGLGLVAAACGLALGLAT